MLYGRHKTKRRSCGRPPAEPCNTRAGINAGPADSEGPKLELRQSSSCRSREPGPRPQPSCGAPQRGADRNGRSREPEGRHWADAEAVRPERSQLHHRRCGHDAYASALRGPVREAEVADAGALDPHEQRLVAVAIVSVERAGDDRFRRNAAAGVAPSGRRRCAVWGWRPPSADRRRGCNGCSPRRIADLDSVDALWPSL
jgi:hypothetical protein